MRVAGAAAAGTRGTMVAGGMIALAATAAALQAPAPGAAAQGGVVHYGGAAGASSKGFAGGSISLLRSPDGSVSGRVGLGVSCARTFFPNNIVRVRGTTSGESFTASGSIRLTRRARLRVKLTGSFAGDHVTGTIRPRGKRIRCRTRARSFALRAETQPAGAPAIPAAGTLLLGLTSQTAGVLRLPVALRRRGDDRLFALWQADMRCGPRARLTAVNFTPATSIRSDGTFSRTERYTIRYGGGLRERYRVYIRGQLLADGARGTLRARMRMRQPGKRFYPCDSGVQSWTAAP